MGDPPFELVVSKLRRPSPRPGAVRRSLLIERVARGEPRPVVSVVAPAGYGKTTLLAQWAERNGQAFAWVSLDERDNDPKVLLTYVAEALDAVEPVGRRVFDALASPCGPLQGQAVAALGFAFSSMISPVVLVLDDVHVLHSSECWGAVSVLADHVPDGSRLVLAGRDEPPLPVARLRAEGRILEIGPRDLALTHEEASSLLLEAGVSASEDDVAELHRRTEGWPAGLYLAALGLRESGPTAGTVDSFGGDDRPVGEYLESEFLARMSRRERVFLTRTAVLERMCGPLCEAVLDQPGAAAILAGLARSNLLLVPLDRQGDWYRCHQLLRDMLLAELRRTEPDLIPVLQRRAAGWCARNGLPEDALEYSITAGDVTAAADLIPELVTQARRQGRTATVQRWLQWLDERDAIRKQPMLVALAGIMSALAGQAADADRWADAADEWQDGDAVWPDDSSAEAWAAVLRATLCRSGVEQMRTDADEAVHKFAASGMAAPPIATIVQGIALCLSGDLDQGDAILANAVSGAEEADSHEASVVALCERALIAMTRGEWARAGALAGQARAALGRAGIEQTFVTPLVCGVHARVALHQGDIPAARQELVSAQRMRYRLTYALPHLAVQARIELARASIMLGDLAGARTLVREINEVFQRRPGLGILAGQARELRDQLSRLRGPGAPGASTLTAAELRLLPLLASHMSFPEIAAELSLSRHTIKTRATSIYRKLGASTRSQSVMRARDLGLLDGLPVASAWR